jgi:hypothetical protein
MKNTIELKGNLLWNSTHCFFNFDLSKRRRYRGTIFGGKEIGYDVFVPMANWLLSLYPLRRFAAERNRIRCHCLNFQLAIVLPIAAFCVCWTRHRVVWSLLQNGYRVHRMSHLVCRNESRLAEWTISCLDWPPLPPPPSAALLWWSTDI